MTRGRGYYPMYRPMSQRYLKSKSYRRYGNKRTGGYLGIENKFIDTFRTGATLGVAWAGGEEDPTENCLNAIAQGDGESNRDGRKCTLTQLNIQGRVLFNPAASDDARFVRVIVVWDTQTNGAQLNAEDVMDDGANKSQQFRNLQFAKRFRVLADLKFMFNQFEGSKIQEQTFNVYKKLPNIQVIHNGTTGTVSTVTDNSIHIIACASGTLCTLTYNSRIRFVG